MIWSYNVVKDWKAHTSVEVLLEHIFNQVSALVGSSLNIEALLTQANVFLQNIDLNTDTLEALVTDSNSKLDDILAELITQTGIMNTHTTALNNIITAVNNADINNVAELQAIQTDLNALLLELQAIETNTAPLEASLTAIEAAIVTAGNNTVTELQAIQVQLGTQITLLTAIDATLDSIYAQFTGTVAINDADISGNAAYGTAAATYNSIQLIVVSGTVTRGSVVYPVGVWPITAPLNKTLPAFTFNATGATAYIELMS
jgi:hypothetical protein